MNTNLASLIPYTNVEHQCSLFAKKHQPTILRFARSTFGRAGEADLVDALRKTAHPQVSLVADLDGRIVGHIFFSPVLIQSDESSFTALGLAPMAVLPEFQNQAIGSKLVRRGLEACQNLGHDVIVVLGHPNYYPRFGFVPAKGKGLLSEYDVLDEVFMVVELTEDALAGRSGIVKYRHEFNEVS